MKVTEQEWISAIAHAMASPDTIKLFDRVPYSFDLFALFSYGVYDRIKGEDITAHLFIDKVVDVITDLLPDRKLNKVELLRTWALLSFETSVYKAWIEEKSIQRIAKP